MAEPPTDGNDRRWNRLAPDPAITPEEWAGAVVQRGHLSILLGRDGALTLMQTDEAGETRTVRIDSEHLLTVAAAAVGLSDFMSPRDADDQILTAMILEYYASGARRDALPPSLQTELEALIDRRLDVARKIDALARPERNGSEQG